jgi:hypothetical protein
MAFDDVSQRYLGSLGHGRIVSAPRSASRTRDSLRRAQTASPALAGSGSSSCRLPVPAR